MHVDGHIANALDRAQHVDAERQVAGEMAVHHIEMDVIGIGDLIEVALEVGHIGRKNGWGDRHVGHTASFRLIGKTVKLLLGNATRKLTQSLIEGKATVKRLLKRKGKWGIHPERTCKLADASCSGSALDHHMCTLLIFIERGALRERDSKRAIA